MTAGRWPSYGKPGDAPPIQRSHHGRRQSLSPSRRRGDRHQSQTATDRPRFGHVRSPSMTGRSVLLPRVAGPRLLLKVRCCFLAVRLTYGPPPGGPFLHALQCSAHRQDSCILLVLRRPASCIARVAPHHLARCHPPAARLFASLG